MSTRQGGVSPEPYGMNLSFRVGDDPSHVSRNRAIFFNWIGVEEHRVAFADQQHSADIRVISNPGRYEQCDGMITADTKLWLAVSVADCAPVFLFDPERRVIGAFHVGWRGSAARIVERGLETMVKEFNTRPSEVMAFIGPCASACCYVVGEEVARRFSSEAVQRVDGSTRLDLKRANKEQLTVMGVRDDHVEVSPHCTVCEGEVFHSYRRDGKTSGRMLGLIGLTE
jgi:YfiH family protein